MMTDEEFRAFLDLLMCSDPWPSRHRAATEAVLGTLADREAAVRGYDSWIAAYHAFKPRLARTLRVLDQEK